VSLGLSLSSWSTGIPNILVKKNPGEILCKNKKLYVKRVRACVTLQERGMGLLLSRQVKADTDENKVILTDDLAVFCFSPQRG